MIFLIVLSPEVSRGEEFRLVPSLSLKEDYNSNILLSTLNGRSDFITTISPGAELIDRTENANMDLLLRLDRLQYAENGALSSTNQMFTGNFGYSPTPLLSISAGAGYVRNSNPTLSLASTGFVSVAVPVNRISSSFSVDYKFSELTEGIVSYTYGTDYYNNSAYLSDISHDITAGLVYDLGGYFRTLKGRTNMSYSYYSFPGSRTDSVNGTVGFSWDLNEIWSASVDSGIRHTWSKIPVTSYMELYQVYQGQPYLVFLPVTEQQKTGSWGWVAKAALNYKTEHGGGGISFTRDIIPAYGLNGASEQNALAVSSQYRLTYEFSALFSGGYTALNSASGGLSSQVIKQNSFRVNPGVRYDFSRDVSLESSYEYTTVDYPTTRTHANRHVVSVRLNMQHPFFE
ncbi:MAG: outer membrane beta-barrel protein [Nitrospirae bacterium]|nr:outer membrane beta-barrel protein [Nitrospirota bacterium]